LFTGQKVLKAKRDFNDPYLWVLAANNQVYRVNSVTFAIVNYTAAFAAYSNLQFIDIAGRSQDTVFIATNSPNVVQYAAGTLSLIGGAQGLPDTVTSVGVDYTGRLQGVIYDTFGHVLLIGTNGGLYRYNMSTGGLVFASDKSYSKVFEATYRKDVFSGFGSDTYGDTVSYAAIECNIPYTIYGSYDWLGGAEFGKKLITSLFVPSAFSDYYYVNNSANFWGTETGMSQNNANNSYSTQYASAHYLNNIQVNKITDIFGLTSFGDLTNYGYPELIKQNLLIGTVNGLYFTASIFDNYNAINGYGTGLRNVTLFHYDPLGTVNINDICVNATGEVQPAICENGVWVSADNGLYYLQPDYGAYLGSQQLDAIGFENQPGTLTTLDLCAGDTAKAVVFSSAYTGNSIQWYKNGTELPGASVDSLAITTPGTYSTVLYDPCSGLHLQSNSLQVNVITSPVFTFNYPAVIPQCGNNPDTLNVTYNPGYRYRWYTNGALNGDTTSSLVVTQSGAYYVEVSACTNSWVPSSQVQVNMITLPVPVITPGKTEYCAEDTATLSAGVPYSSAYTFNWFLNGTSVTTGNGQPTLKTLTAGTYTVTITSTADAACSQTSVAYQLSFVPPPGFSTQFPPEYTSCGTVSLSVQTSQGTTLSYRWYTNNVLNGDTTNTFLATQSGQYRVESSSCPGSWVSSNTLQLTVVTLPMPAVTANKATYCTGDDAVLTANVPAGPLYTITWYNNGVALPAYNDQTSITTNLAGNYTVALTSSQPASTGTACSDTSAAVAVSFTPLPTVSISEQVTNALCQGQSVNLTAKYANGSLLWSTGETSAEITVNQTGTYTATVTSASGCQKDTGITLTFLPDPVLNVGDTSICVYKQQTVTLTAPAGFAVYSWDGIPGVDTYTVRQPGTVTLTVTDVNGCQATQHIKVADECSSVYIPNTITPNGDGINDTWVIEGLDETATVKLFTRWGRQVFNSLGYGTPFDGRYAGQKLPTGVYYYIVTAKNNTRHFSGWLTIIY
jgi:gliding motility-associated-like protein